MNNENNSPLQFFLKWSYNEPKHPEKSMTKFTWDTGIEMTIAGPKLKFDNNTSLNGWKAFEIKKHKNLMKVFKKDKKIQALDYSNNPSNSDKEKIENDSNFIKWVD